MLMAVASGLTLFAKSVLYPAILLAILVFVLIIGGVNARMIWRRVRVMFATIIFLFILQSVFAGMGGGALHGTANTPVFMIDGHGFIYVEGIMLAALLSLRLLVILFAALVLTSANTGDYLLALIRMKIPYELAFMVTVSLHFLPIMRVEAVSTYRCMLMRGMEFSEIGIVRKFKAYAKLCLPIFASVLRRARDYSVAMESRSFRAGRRTYFRSLCLRGSDVALIILWPVLFGGIFVLTEVII